MTIKNHKIGKTGLMLVEDPEDTLKTMCQFEDSTLDLHRFKATYEEIKQKSRPIHEKHAHTHFYTLTIYGLIVQCESAPKGIYKVSPVGKEICECLNRQDIKKFKQILSNILLNNPRKGHLFNGFLKYVSGCPKRSKKEIYTRFKALPGRTLIAWSKAAGLIETNKGFVWSLPQEKERVTLNQFQERLAQAYKEMSQAEMLGIEKVFVEISELRQKVCIAFSWSLKEFDEYLTLLLNSPFGEKIRLYGGPSSVFDESENFMYNRRLYVYIRIKV